MWVNGIEIGTGANRGHNFAVINQYTGVRLSCRTLCFCDDETVPIFHTCVLGCSERR